MPGILLIVLSLGFMLFRVVSPRGAKLEGRLLGAASLSYWERMSLQRINLCSLAVILFLGGIGHWIRLPFEVLAIVAAYGILLVPVRYRVTAQGIGLNHVVFRHWHEFAAIDTSEKKIVLRGRPGNGHFTLWLAGRHQADVLPLLRRHVPEARRPAPQTDEKGGSTAKQTRRRLSLPRRA